LFLKGCRVNADDILGAGKFPACDNGTWFWKIHLSPVSPTYPHGDCRCTKTLSSKPKPLCRRTGGNNSSK
jgi:hypothetical protein